MSGLPSSARITRARLDLAGSCLPDCVMASLSMNSNAEVKVGSLPANGNDLPHSLASLSDLL